MRWVIAIVALMGCGRFGFDPEEPYLPWGASYPSFIGPGCVILDPVARTYRDGDCAQSLPYVCECDQIPVDPTSY